LLFLPPLDALPLKVCKEGVLLFIKASPKASKDAMGKIEPGDHHPVLKIYVKAIAESGKANDAIVNLLKEKLKIKKADILLKSGLTQRLKTFLIKGKTLEEIVPFII
jgi:uncharacterized protein (TIGR00251 family)